MPEITGASDLPVVALVTLSLLGINVLVGVGISAVHPREEGPATWALANVLFAVGVAVLMLRIPQQEPFVALFGNVTFVASYLLTWIGLRRFRFRPVQYRIAAAIMLCHLGIFAWFLFGHPDIVMRVTVTACTAALLCGLITWTMLFRIEAGLVQTQAFIGMLFGALGMIYLLRAVAAATGALQPSDFGGGPLGASIFVLPVIASLMTAAACILMLNQRLQLRLQLGTQTDALTGLITRGLLDNLGDKEIARAKRHGYGLSVVVFELDQFHAISGKHGYDTGDALLRRVALLVTSNLRHEDFVARLDDCSFTLMLPSTRMAGAQQLAERLRQEISSMTADPAIDGLSLTASFGIASLGLHSDIWGEIMQRAQSALYRAKTDGGNRIEIAAFSEIPLERSA
ncbi:MAG: GGDEF domain-containing protein [Ferrovibrio sp.]